MERVRRRPLSLVLRRFENEAIELLFANTQISAVQDSAVEACRISAIADGDGLLYAVLLSDGLVVRPVDWRRFAYDHAKVGELLSLCVRDNLMPLSFEETWSDDLRECIETTLTSALGDLSSVFDVKSVGCKSSEDLRLLISIEGEHKNGERFTYVVSSNIGPP